MEKVLISVIIPTYNEEKFISVCLSSLKKQNFNKEKDYEIIVVDNGSTDNTAQIVKDFKVKLIYEPQKGISFAIKKGISESKGKIIALTNADTAVNPDWISNICKAFDNNSNVVAVSGRLILIPRSFLSCLSEFFINYVGGKILRNLLSPNFAIRKDIYYKVGGIKENINFNCETELFLRVKKEGTILFLWDNPVITSSRHFRGVEGIKYCIRGIISSISLLFFKKAIFVNMVDVR